MGSGAGGLPMPEMKSPQEVRREANRRSETIFTNYETLHQIVQRHEATIRKRWLKKTRQQRLKILLSAWPDMPTMHRPDFDAFRKESMTDRDKGTKYRDSFIWPYINQEDLLSTKTFPLMLNARGRNPPGHFAASDTRAMNLGVVTKALVPIFLNQHVMILNNMTGNTREYGKLMAWDEHPDAFEWMSSLKQFLPGEGLLVLEAQERVLTFLVYCCRQLIHDIPASDLTSETYPVVPEPPIKPESEITGFDSLGVMAAEAPYRAPSQLNLDHIASLLAARASAAEDHLWALREDPSYFARTILDFKDHRQEMLKDLDGRDHPVHSRGRQGILWSRIIGSALSEAYLEVEAFSELTSQAKKLASMQRQYADNISPSEDLPEDFSKALMQFKFFVDQIAKGPLNMLKMAGVASPPLRKFFIRQPPPDTQTSKIVVVSKPGVKPNSIEQQLLWLLKTLWEDDRSLFLLGLPATLDELDRLLQSETRAGDLMSSYLTKVVGDLSIIAQCLNQLELYQPWARTFEMKLPEFQDDFQKEYTHRSDPWGRILSALKEKNIQARAADLGAPSNGKFTYPIEKRRTRENVDTLRRAEEHLDAFWASIDQLLIAKAGNLSGTAVHEFLSKSRILQRTPEWTEPEKLPSTSAQKGADSLDMTSLYHAISPIYYGLSAKELDIQQPKTKVKTRGVSAATPQASTESEAVLQPNPADAQPAFTVDARAMKVFRTVFFNPAVSSTPGEVPWTDFLHAMTSAGFSIMKLYGSVWQFQPTRLDVERNIQFHEPHPRGKIPFTTARRIGRRLNRAYGWHGNMFTLAEK